MNYGKKATMQLLRKYDNKSSKVKIRSSSLF